METNLDLSTYFIGSATLLLASFSSLFSVVNPLAAMPVFLSLTAKETEHDRNSIARRSTTYMFFILLIFFLIGTYILSFFGIHMSGIQIAGGIIIMRAAFSMLSPEKSGKKLSKEDEEAAKEKDDITFTPLAMPLLSGPGSIAVVIGFASQASNVTDYIITAISITLVSILSFGILRVSPVLAKYLGRTGLAVMTRMMGFIALSISVQFILNGISKFFNLS